MSRGLNSPFLKRWFWKEVWENLKKWLRDAPIILKAFLWITVGLFSWICIVSYFPETKTIVRATGAFLQLCGFTIAAYGIERMLEKFGQVRSTSRIVPWVKELRDIFVLRRKLVYRSEMTKHGESTEVSIPIVEDSTPNPAHPSLAVRMDMLEWKIEEIKKEVEVKVEKVKKDLANEIEKLENEIKEDVEAVEHEVEKVNEKFKEVNVGEGALWLEWGGVFFFVYGVPLAAFPSFFKSAFWILTIPVAAGGLLGTLHWYSD